MKKINKVISITAILSIFAISFTACFNPVFYQVNQDVVSESAMVSGSINSIARYTVADQEYLVLAGGQELSQDLKGLLYKKVEADKTAESNAHGQWKVYPIENLPFELHHYDYYDVQNHVGEQIIKVVTGPEYLYLVTATYTNNSELGTNCPEKINIWATIITDWATSTKADWINLMEGDAATRDDQIAYLPLYDDSEYTNSAFNILSTNAPIKENRSVYIRSGNGTEAFPVRYFKINGTEISEITDVHFLAATILEDKTKTFTELSTSSSTVLINTVVSVNGSDLFFAGANGVTTNETYSTNASLYYVSLDDYVVYGSSYSDPVKTVKVGSTIASLAYCKDAILIGCGSYISSSSTADAGIEKVQLVDDIPALSLGNFETNAQSQLLSSYIVMTLLNATPENTELESTLYAGINFAGTATSTQATFKNIGLWSYYAQRGNWNKE